MRELPRRLTVMAEYEAFPVWGPDAMIRRERLPISAGLAEALESWCTEYDRLNIDNLWPSAAYYDEWRRRGRALAVRLRDELGSDFEVWYGDWEADGPERV